VPAAIRLSPTAAGTGSLNRAKLDVVADRTLVHARSRQARGKVSNRDGHEISLADQAATRAWQTAGVCPHGDPAHGTQDVATLLLAAPRSHRGPGDRAAPPQFSAAVAARTRHTERVWTGDRDARGAGITPVLRVALDR
jgi:hypothetical protein